ncbi:4085_t:CDS:1, partial [Cetraspora pellucida]
EHVRQPKGPPSLLQSEEDFKNYYITKYLKDMSIFSQKELDTDYSIKPFQRLYPQQNQSMRIDRIESKIDEISQMISQFERMMVDNQSKKPVAKSNLTY